MNAIDYFNQIRAEKNIITPEKQRYIDMIESKTKQVKPINTLDRLKRAEKVLNKEIEKMQLELNLVKQEINIEQERLKVRDFMSKIV